MNSKVAPAVPGMSFLAQNLKLVATLASVSSNHLLPLSLSTTAEPTPHVNYVDKILVKGSHTLVLLQDWTFSH